MPSSFSGENALAKKGLDAVVANDNACSHVNTPETWIKHNNFDQLQIFNRIWHFLKTLGSIRS